MMTLRFIILCVALAAGSAAFGQPQQAAAGKPGYLGDARGSVFCEIALVQGKQVQIYNSAGVSDCPAGKLKAINTKALAGKNAGIRRRRDDSLFF